MSAAPEPTLPGLLREIAGRHPDRTAIWSPDRSLTYADLAGEASAVAQALAGGRGPVGVLCASGAEVAVAVFGVVAAGRVSVTLDPSEPDAALTRLLDDAGATELVASATLAARPLGRPALTPGAPSARPLPDPGDPAAPATISYTSGTTAAPRGVVHSHRGLAQAALKYGRALGVGPDDRLTMLASPHQGAAVADLLTALLNGACLLPMPARELGLLAVLDRLLQGRATILHAAPTLHRQLMAAAGDRLTRSALRLVRLGGEALPGRDVDLHFERMPPGCELVHTLSATELSGICLHRVPRGGERAPRTPVGRPMPDVELTLRDPDGAPVPAGEVGEIVVSSPFLALGYHGLPALTARRFLPHPTDPTRRVYRTGDLGRLLPTGELLHLGRLDHQVKLRGQRVDLALVEAALRDQPGIVDAAAVLRDTPAGPQLWAFVTGAAPPTDALPGPMRPARLVVLDALPQLASGKVDRRALAAWQPAPAETPPADALEAWVIDRWRELLHHTPGPDERFFEVGGDSLRALALLAEIEVRFGRALPLTALLEHPTPAALAALLRAPAAPQAIVALRAEGARPPLFCVHGIDGEALRFAPLARRLDRPLYGLQAHGLGDADLASIPALASRYLTDVCRVQPSGPYHLAGYSAGGTIALEMAAQLVGRGEVVAWLGLLDDVAPGARARGPTRLLRFAANLPAFVHDRLTTLTPRQLLTRTALTLRRRRARAAELMDLSDLSPSRVAIAERVFAARAAYVPPVYPGKITLIRATIRKLRDPFLPDHGWAPYAGGGLEVRDVIASHEHLCSREPYVSRLAAALRASLDAAR